MSVVSWIEVQVAFALKGRGFSRADKRRESKGFSPRVTNGYNFIYRQHVIKPALIGLIGAWISGVIEWDVPFHHRASTFLPVQYKTEENADGSKTIWVGELEPRQRMRWAVGVHIAAGKGLSGSPGEDSEPYAGGQHDAAVRQPGDQRE